MKRNLIYAITLVTLVSCNEKRNQENLTHKTEIMQKEETQKIETLLSEYKKSLLTSNAILAKSLYTKDGIFMPTDAPSAIGHENILKSYEFIFSQIQLDIEFYIEEIKIDGNLAFATTSSKGNVLIHALGKKMPEANRELFIFEKLDNEWKIARYMFNKTEPKK